MKTNFRLSALISQLCAILLTFLGFSCNSDMPDMYGTMTGTWEVKGKVTDEADAPVSDATIKVTYPNVNSSEYSAAVVETNSEGAYSATRKDCDTKLKVVCLPKSPGLEADSTIVNLDYSPADKNNGWDRGHAEVTVDFKLSKKEP